ncbi:MULTISPECIES: RHS repeat-associated core domain-containing protein [Arthrobacter]|nr:MULTISPECIES: RHS repeat-associated core domain-containing protein [Arthrobacter]MBT8162598.1 hypothetical protein [Arthrobacter sp. GN70]
MTSSGWSVSLAMTVGTTVSLTATVNQPLDGTGQWLEIFDMSSTGTMNYLNYCNTGTTCSSTTIPAENQSTYIAVVGNTITNSYAEYAPSSASAWSNQVTPPAWTITLTANITTSIGLTATSNYAATGTTYLEIFDTAKPQTGGITYLNFCNSGTTCTATTVPQEKGASYIAVVTHGSTNTYPPSSIIATSSPVTPPPWTITLTASGTTVTATTNYAAGYNVYVEIFDISKPQTYITYIQFCSSGAVCTGTTSSPSHQFIATVGNISNYYPPSSIIALSNQVSTSGPTAPYETVGGSNPAEVYCPQCAAGDPVNTSNGEFYENTTDVSIAGRGPGLTVSRTYSSQRASFDGPLGFGWSFNYSMSLALNSSGTVDIHQENGSMVTFTPDAGGLYHAPARVVAALVHNADGTWTYTRRAKDIFTFTSSGQLSSLSDLNGNATTLARNASGQLTTATDSAGRTLTFAYNAGGRIATIADPAGRVFAYGYDSAGRLTSYTAPGGAVTGYGYDASNLITSVTDPRGTATVNTYDQAQRVTKQTTPAGDLLISYGVDGSDAQTTITSPGGRITKETYRSGQMIKRITGAGSPQESTWLYAYDQNTFGATSATDPLGHVSSATYDSVGNRLTATDPANHQQSWTYNTLNQVTTATDAAGTVTTYSYDTSGNPLSVSTPLTGTSQTATTSYAHTDSSHPGDITAITGPDGHTTTLTHTTTGALASSTDPLGNTTSFTYDALGRRLTSVSPPGNTTANSYDTAGHLTTVTDPLNHTTTYSYDADGNRTALTDANGNTTVTAYDTVNRPTTVTNPDNTVTTTAYDADGNRTSTTDALGHATTYTYDALNMLTSSTDPLNRTTSYAYDSAGHPVTVTDPAGRTTTNTFDVAGNRTGTSYSGGATPSATFTYTATGKTATMTDGTGTTTNTYDALGRLTASTNGAGQATGYSYDLSGHLTALAYPNGQTVNRAYDAAGHLTGITDWSGHTTTFTPDADGNAVSTTYGNGVTAAATFDASGQLSAITDTGPGSTALASFTYTRNNVGALASSTITGITQPAETYSYTSRDQLAAVNTSTYSYDSAGNATALASGATLAYDAASQASSYTLSGTITAITYDTQGNRLTGPAPGGTTASYTWDQANRLTAANGTTYAYNADGLRTTRTPATGAAQHFAWDSRPGVPLMLTDGTTSYLYDDAGHPVEQIDGTGAALYYQHDQYGSTRLLTDQTGVAAASYTYDANGNLTAKTGTADTVLRWNGQTQDTDTGLYYLRARYYDPATAQFLSVDPLASITKAIYTYADNNPLNKTDPLGLSSNPLNISDGDSGGSCPNQKHEAPTMDLLNSKDNCIMVQSCNIYGTPSWATYTPNVGPIDPKVANNPANTFGCRLNAAAWFLGPLALARIPSAARHLSVLGKLPEVAQGWTATGDTITVSGIVGGGLCSIGQ